MLVAGSVTAGLVAGSAGAAALMRSSETDEQTDTGSQAPAVLLGAEPPRHVALIALDAPEGWEKGPTAAVGNLTATLRDVSPGKGHATLALGHRLFTRSGSSGRTPRLLKPMPSFPGDVLDPSHSHGDVLVQLAADSRAAVTRAEQDLTTRLAGWTPRWRISGFRADSRAQDGRGLAKNPFHFTEGFGNPGDQRSVDERALVRRDQGEPAWAVGGTYQVVRIIRLATELWDKDTVEEQEHIIGRRRDGRWLDGTPVQERANFAADPRGRRTPLDSHVRLAAPDPRNPPPLVRRSYSYDRGDGDVGLVFSCFQRDLEAGFETVQRRLAGESMAKYLLTTGGGYYFVPPRGGEWVRAAF
ncbi:Dyp-type peroxidase [Streptomyces tritici]|uniref:Dyp-type peroxidase n=1 Tax=Streptomyces tritici TaxID=2054410 RepID=UPI003AF0AC68